MITTQPDPQEIVRYFSDFLSEINSIIQNIKKHTYELVDISVPNTSLLTVYESIASIISNTHKTFDNLKRIESIMSGVVKSKRMKIVDPPITPLNTHRSKSLDNEFFFYPKHPHKKHPKAQNNILVETDSRTIKKAHLQMSNLKTKELAKQELQELKNDKDFDKSEEDEKTVKMFSDRGLIQGKKEVEKPFKDWKNTISERIKALINSNKATLSTIMDRNMECLRLVRSVKKDYKSR